MEVAEPTEALAEEPVAQDNTTDAPVVVAEEQVAHDGTEAPVETAACDPTAEPSADVTTKAETPEGMRAYRIFFRISLSLLHSVNRSNGT